MLKAAKTPHQAVEMLIDQVGYVKFIQLVAEVSAARAEAIRFNTKDEERAERWDRASGKLMRVSGEIERLGTF